METFQLSVTLEEADNVHVIFDRIIIKLRPDWVKSETLSEKLSGGMLNCLVCYWQSGDKNREDAIVLRVFDKALDQEKMIDRENEFLAMQLGHQAGVFPPVLGLFINGMIYKYAQGRKISYYGPEFYEETIIRRIDTALAKLHLIDPDKCDLVGIKGQRLRYPEESTLHPYVRNVLEQATLSEETRMAKFQVTGVTAEELLQEWDWINDHLKDLGLTRSFSHNDITHGNMVYNDQTESFTLIDYEFASYAYECNDFVFLYDSYVYFNTTGRVPAGAPPVSDSLIRCWQRFYLEERYKLQGRNPGDITDEVLQLFSLECAICMVLMKLEVVAIIYAVIDFSPNHLPLQMDMMVPACWDEYKARKQDLPRLIKEYQEMKKQGVTWN